MRKCIRRNSVNNLTKFLLEKRVWVSNTAIVGIIKSALKLHRIYGLEKYAWCRMLSSRANLVSSAFLKLVDVSTWKPDRSFSLKNLFVSVSIET
jgi:hypothetical protein